MTYLNCPHCNLAMQVRAAYPAPRNRPRCIARRLRRALPRSGTDTAA